MRGGTLSMSACSVRMMTVGVVHRDLRLDSGYRLDNGNRLWVGKEDVTAT